MRSKLQLGEPDLSTTTETAFNSSFKAYCSDQSRMAFLADIQRGKQMKKVRRDEINDSSSPRSGGVVRSGGGSGGLSGPSPLASPRKATPPTCMMAEMAKMLAKRSTVSSGGGGSGTQRGRPKNGNPSYSPIRGAAQSRSPVRKPPSPAHTAASSRKSKMAGGFDPYSIDQYSPSLMMPSLSTFSPPPPTPTFAAAAAAATAAAVPHPKPAAAVKPIIVARAQRRSERALVEVAARKQLGAHEAGAATKQPSPTRKKRQMSSSSKVVVNTDGSTTPTCGDRTSGYEQPPLDPAPCKVDIAAALRALTAAGRSIAKAVAARASGDTAACVAGIADTVAYLADAGASVNSAVASCGAEGSECATDLLEVVADLAKATSAVAVAVDDCRHT